MGCDIHAFVEYPERYSDGYQTFSDDELWLPRDYVMFGVMAGVRIPTEDVYGGFEPRGLPDNINYHTKESWGIGGYHTPSWLTCMEFNQAILNRNQTSMNFAREAEKEGRVYLRHDVGREYYAVAAAMRELGDESRIVFWFDN